MSLACPECGPTAEVVVANIDANPTVGNLDFRCEECGTEPIVYNHLSGGSHP